MVAAVQKVRNTCAGSSKKPVCIFWKFCNLGRADSKNLLDFPLRNGCIGSEFIDNEFATGNQTGCVSLGKISNLHSSRRYRMGILGKNNAEFIKLIAALQKIFLRFEVIALNVYNDMGSIAAVWTNNSAEYKVWLPSQVSSSHSCGWLETDWRRAWSAIRQAVSCRSCTSCLSWGEVHVGG